MARINTGIPHQKIQLSPFEHLSQAHFSRASNHLIHFPALLYFSLIHTYTQWILLSSSSLGFNWASRRIDVCTLITSTIEYNVPFCHGTLVLNTLCSSLYHFALRNLKYFHSNPVDSVVNLG